MTNSKRGSKKKTTIGVDQHSKMMQEPLQSPNFPTDADHKAVAVHSSAHVGVLGILNKLDQQLISIEESSQDTRKLLKQIAHSALEILKADVIELYEYVP